MVVRSVLRDEYEKFDYLKAQTEECKAKIFEKARSMEWETDHSTLPDDEMSHILTTAPQVGELTAILWLAMVITPRRFRNAKALSSNIVPRRCTAAGQVTFNLLFPK